MQLTEADYRRDYGVASPNAESSVFAEPLLIEAPSPTHGPDASFSDQPSLFSGRKQRGFRRQFAAPTNALDASESGILLPAPTATAPGPAPTADDPSCPLSNNTAFTEPTSGITYQIECGIDRQTGTGHTYIWMETFRDCIDACASDYRCDGATWFPTTPGQVAACDIKFGAGPPAYISGAWGYRLIRYGISRFQIFATLTGSVVFLPLPLQDLRHQPAQDRQQQLCRMDQVRQRHPGFRPALALLLFLHCPFPPFLVQSPHLQVLDLLHYQLSPFLPVRLPLLPRPPHRPCYLSVRV